MSFWSGDKLEYRLGDLIDPFDPDKIDCAAYELRMGGQFYVSPSRHEENADRKTAEILGVDRSFAIPPGQFALLITEETVTVPEDAIAFISMKAKIKFNGLVNVSGFHVDPGYHGKILFSVFNAGPAPVHVKRRERLFLIWYADLDVAKFDTKYKKHPSSGHKWLASEYVNKISGPILSLKSLDEKLRALEAEWQKYRAYLEFFKAVAIFLIGLLIPLGSALIVQLFSL